MNLPAVQTDKLTRRFGTFVAVDAVSIQVAQGEIFGFLGANGAGKTTMIRMLCGLLLPSEGSATVAGCDVYTQAEEIKRNIGYMSQKFSLYDDLTPEENITFFGGVYWLSEKQIAEKQHLLIKQLGLERSAKRLTSELPLGFKQRLALGCAILHDPPIVFLDEPTSGVDPLARRSFWDLIYDMAAAGKTIFMTTHFMDEAEYCHRVSIMRSGRVIAIDAPNVLKQRLGKSTMQEVFMELVEGKNADALE